MDSKTGTIPTWDRETLRAALVRDHGEAGIGPVWTVVSRWLDRGDGCAVYENQDLGHYDVGQRQFVSYGSVAAQLETAEPPVRLPDIGSAINWRYGLIAVCKD